MMVITPAKTPEEWFYIPNPKPLRGTLAADDDVPWWDAPYTWSLGSRLLLAGAVAVGAIGITYFAVKKGPPEPWSPSPARRSTRRGY